MKTNGRKILKALTPPLIWSAARSLVHPQTEQFSGDYKTWDEAKARTRGYENPAIFEKVKNAALKVKRGEAAFERDSVNFDHIEYSWPVLAALLWISSQNGNRLNLIDFGGSLGSSYFQNRNFLSHLAALRWSVVEQGHFAEFGKQHLADEHLKFYGDLAECASGEHPDAVLLSSVLPYLPKPYEILAALKAMRPKYIVIDRTPVFVGASPDRITVQRVSPKVYDASYPAWFFNQEKLLRFLAPDYELVADWDALAGSIELGTDRAVEKGFLFKEI